MSDDGGDGSSASLERRCTTAKLCEIVASSRAAQCEAREILHPHAWWTVPLCNDDTPSAAGMRASSDCRGDLFDFLHLESPQTCRDCFPETIVGLVEMTEKSAVVPSDRHRPPNLGVPGGLLRNCGARISHASQVRVDVSETGQIFVSMLLRCISCQHRSAIGRGVRANHMN